MIEQSESIGDLAAGLLAFHKEVGKVGKDSDNPFFKSKYASLSNILDAIEGPLQKAGLAVVQMPSGQNTLATQIVHESGEWMRSEYAMNVKEANNPQALGSAITYSRRYALAAALCLNIDEDDDGNSAAPQRTAPRPATTHFVQDDQPRDIEEGPVYREVISAPKKTYTADERYEEGWVEVNVASVFKGTSKDSGTPYTMVKTTDNQTYFYGRDFKGTLMGGVNYRLHLEGKNITSAEEI